MKVDLRGLVIKKASPSDAREVSSFCQPVYELVYPNEKYGIKPEHFAPWIFESEDTIKYFASVLENREDQVAYKAIIKGRIVGTVAVTDFGNYYEPRCFYVGLDYQGLGIGKKLWSKALEFCTKDIPIIVEVGETNIDTIKLYESWGFRVNKSLGIRMRHWPEWPDDLKNGYIHMQKEVS